MRILFTLLAIAFVPAERHFQDAGKTDLERLQGSWLLVHIEREHPITPDKMLNNQIQIRGNEYKRFTLEEPPILVRTFRLDPTTEPKSIDLIAKNPNGEDWVFRGIYEIRGDTFRLCFAMLGKERPKEFRVGPNSTANTVTTYRLLNRP